MSQQQPATQNRMASRTRSRSPISRPTTPLRPSSRSSFRNSQSNGISGPSPLDTLDTQFAELSDSMADLEANLMHLQLMHESLSRFSESFASFLYGLNMNAFVVDFPEAPLSDSIKRHQKQQRQRESNDFSSLPVPSGGLSKSSDVDATFMTNDISFASMKTTPRRRTMGGSATMPGSTSTATSKSSIPSARGGNTTTGTRGASRVARGSGLPRGRGRGVKS